MMADGRKPGFCRSGWRLVVSVTYSHDNSTGSGSCTVMRARLRATRARVSTALGYFHNRSVQLLTWSAVTSPPWLSTCPFTSTRMPCKRSMAV